MPLPKADQSNKLFLPKAAKEERPKSHLGSRTPALPPRKQSAGQKPKSPKRSNPPHPVISPHNPRQQPESADLGLITPSLADSGRAEGELEMRGGEERPEGTGGCGDSLTSTPPVRHPSFPSQSAAPITGLYTHQAPVTQKTSFGATTPVSSPQLPGAPNIGVSLSPPFTPSAPLPMWGSPLAVDFSSTLPSPTPSHPSSPRAAPTAAIPASHYPPTPVSPTISSFPTTAAATTAAGATTADHANYSLFRHRSPTESLRGSQKHEDDDDNMSVDRPFVVGPVSKGGKRSSGEALSDDDVQLDRKRWRSDFEAKLKVGLGIDQSIQYVEHKPSPMSFVPTPQSSPEVERGSWLKSEPGRARIYTPPIIAHPTFVRTPTQPPTREFALQAPIKRARPPPPARPEYDYTALEHSIAYFLDHGAMPTSTRIDIAIPANRGPFSTVPVGRSPPPMKVAPQPKAVVKGKVAKAKQVKSKIAAQATQVVKSKAAQKPKGQAAGTAKGYTLGKAAVKTQANLRSPKSKVMAKSAIKFKEATRPAVEVSTKGGDRAGSDTQKAVSVKDVRPVAMEKEKVLVYHQIEGARRSSVDGEPIELVSPPSAGPFHASGPYSTSTTGPIPTLNTPPTSASPASHNATTSTALDTASLFGNDDAGTDGDVELDGLDSDDDDDEAIAVQEQLQPQATALPVVAQEQEQHDVASSMDISPLPTSPCADDEDPAVLADDEDEDEGSLPGPSRVEARATAAMQSEGDDSDMTSLPSAMTRQESGSTDATSAVIEVDDEKAIEDDSGIPLAASSPHMTPGVAGSVNDDGMDSELDGFSTSVPQPRPRHDSDSPPRQSTPPVPRRLDAVPTPVTAGPSTSSSTPSWQTQITTVVDLQQLPNESDQDYVKRALATPGVLGRWEVFKQAVPRTSRASETEDGEIRETPHQSFRLPKASLV